MQFGSLALTRSFSQDTVPGEQLRWNISTLLPGLPRGAITEIVGAGRTSIAHSLLATATRSGEVCVMVDASDAFDPGSARQAGVDLGKLLWVQCQHRVEYAMRAADMILHAGGFGLVMLDLSDASPQSLQRIPLSYWFRFQRTVENTQTVLVILGNQINARSCAARQISLQQQRIQWSGQAPGKLLDRMEIQASLRKPVSPRTVSLEAVARG